MSMTMQEFFDKAIRHIVMQGEQSENFGRCEYRGPNDLKCVIGVFISDKEYSYDMEGIEIAELLDSEQFTKYPLDTLRTVPPGCDRETWIIFLTRMQGAHDHSSTKNGLFLHDFMIAMKGIAIQFNLTMPHVEEERAGPTNEY